VRGNLRRGLALARRRTQRGPAMVVRLYERPGCGLCAETYRALTRIRMDMPLVVERVDIERDPALRERYVIRIPVLRVEERELDSAGLDDEALKRWLTGMRPSLG
jgi:glutaredoxin